MANSNSNSNRNRAGPAQNAAKPDTDAAAPATPASPAPQEIPVQELPGAEAQWLETKKIVHSMSKCLEQIGQEDAGSKKLLADLEGVEHLLERLRLACMTITFTDFKFAHKNRVLDRLWNVHTLVSTEYKRGLQRHRGHGQIVPFRTIEKQYGKHLKTSQYFYKGFVQRLAARYRLGPLQRVGHAINTQALNVNEVIDAHAADLALELTVACYRTILHMGDIARYRLHASRQRGLSSDVAMTYYALAQDLMPQDGDAHHQMAVVLADQRRDFDVVYHFVRSWSVEHPSQLTPKNLVSEFRKLLQPPNSRRHGNALPDPYDMFGSWFVRLHANYFKGEDFKSQQELEREVLHRWDELLKNAERPEYLLKAVLLNIGAYDIALRRLKDEFSTAGSQSCKFILCFIVQTIVVLGRVLESEMGHLFDPPPVDEEPSTPEPPKPAPHAPHAPHAPQQAGGRQRNRRRNADPDRDAREKRQDREKDKADRDSHDNKHDNKHDKVSAKKSTPAATCLSLFRICMAWINSRQTDLTSFRGHLAPHLSDMHRAGTRCLTMLIDVVSSTDAAIPTTYLLPEDIEVLGLAPLDAWTALHESGSESPYKPHYNDVGVERKDAKFETLARIFNIVESAVDLLDNPEFPWFLETVEQDGQTVKLIHFKENFVPMTQPSQSTEPSVIEETVLASYSSHAVPASAGTAPSPAPAVATAAPATAARHVQVMGAAKAGAAPSNARNSRQKEHQHVKEVQQAPQPHAGSVKGRRTRRSRRPPSPGSTAPVPSTSTAPAEPVEPTEPTEPTEPAPSATVGVSAYAAPAPVASAAADLGCANTDMSSVPDDVAPESPVNMPAAQHPQASGAPRKASYKDVDDDDDFFFSGAAGNITSSVQPAPGAQAPSTSNFDEMDSAMYDQIQTFLNPPEINSQQQQSFATPTYGMPPPTTATFGQQPSSRPIPSTPWNTASLAPNQAQGRSVSTGAASGYSSSLSYYANLGPYTGPPSLANANQNTFPNTNASPNGRQYANIEEQLAFLTVKKEAERRVSEAAGSSPMPMQAAPIAPMGVSQSASQGNAGHMPLSYATEGISRGFPSSLFPVGSAARQQQSPMGGFSSPWGTAPSAGGAGVGSSQMSYSSNFSLNGTMPPVQGFSQYYQPQQPQQSQLQQQQQQQQLQQQVPSYENTYDHIYGGFGGNMGRHVSAATGAQAWPDMSSTWARGPEDDEILHSSAAHQSQPMNDQTGFGPTGFGPTSFNQNTFPGHGQGRQ